MQLYSNGHKLFRPEKAHRVGDSIRYTWSAFDTGTGTKLCVRFAHSNRVACESTRYSGVPGPV